MTGIEQVWPTTHVLPVAVPIHAQRLITGDAFDQLNFVGLIAVFVIGDRLRAVPDFCPHVFTLVDDFLHLFLNEGEVIRHERFFAVKVVVPTVFDHRPDCDLYIWPDFLHGARHNVSEIMADKFQRRFFVFHGVDCDPAVAFDWPLEVIVLTVHGGRDRLFAERRRDVSSHVSGGDTSFVLTCVTVGECE